MIFIAVCSGIIWLWLFFFHGCFWVRGPILYPVSPAERAKRNDWPDVHVVVPARDEAETIREVVLSLLKQDYLGQYDVTVVDDESLDGTGDIVRNSQTSLPEVLASRLHLINADCRPEGWSGKLWALSAGVAELQKRSHSENSFFFFTDADIVHDPSHLTTLVNKAQSDGLDQVSEMVQLRCKALWEKMFIPAFVYFFCMLYPFSKVNKPSSPVAAGAGGTVLIRRKALLRIGGIASLKSALIDDVTLSALVKKKGGKIYLGHSKLAMSLRSYTHISDIWNMITRTAYVQLKYSISLLILTIILMSLMWFFPLIQLLTATGITKKIAIVTYVISILSFLPTLSRFNLLFLWMFALPFIGLFYLLATVASAVNYYRGKGMMWKGRAYTTPSIDVNGKESQVSSSDLVSSQDNGYLEIQNNNQKCNTKG